MKSFARNSHMPLFVPDYMASSLTSIDFELLKASGVRFIAFDADSTLVPFRGKILTEEVKQFLSEKRGLFKGWCIASNRLTNDLLPLAESMDAQVIRATLTNRKPQRRFFEQVIRHFGCEPHEIAMIGDKLIADMWGAKRAGLTTVWVEKIGTDSPWDRLFHLRRTEKKLIKKYLPENQ
ncbi:MAG: putative hydrolase of the superfamily [Candidatus Saccharibacteria bacterium]|nr:putative hydrolase of the superfamily [Candidatus Saccharibacteria bacterium]